MFIYEILLDLGLCGDLYVDEEDKHRAMMEYSTFAVNGLVNNFMLSQVKKAGNDAQELKGLAYTSARKRTIIEAYERMKSEKINFVELLNIKK